MRLLFIGGTGNISRPCVERALADGHDVTLLTRGRTPSPFDDRVRVRHGDRDDPGALAAAVADRPDAVVDFVAYRPEQVEAVLGACGGRTGQYVFISSTAAYQKPPRQPVLTERTPLDNPFWSYARDKIACEALLSRAHREDGFPVTIVRPSYTYGESWLPTGFGHDYTVVGRMRRGAPVVCHGDGTSLWVMTHADDFAVGLVGLLGRSEALGEAFHVTSDEVLTWNRIYALTAEAAGCEAEIVHVASELIAALCPERGPSLLGDKAHSVIFDNSKIRSLVPGFAPEVGFARGIARSVAWFDADPVRRTVNPAIDQALDRLVAARGRALEE